MHKEEAKPGFSFLTNNKSRVSYPRKVTPTIILLPSIAMERKLVIGWKLLSLDSRAATVSFLGFWFYLPGYLDLYESKRPRALIVSHFLSLQCLSSLFLNVFVVPDVTTLSGRLFQ